MAWCPPPVSWCLKFVPSVSCGLFVRLNAMTIDWDDRDLKLFKVRSASDLKDLPTMTGDEWCSFLHWLPVVIQSGHGILECHVAEVRHVVCTCHECS